MAQTKRKRRTKHRGNAAGTIETRGRTGRPLSAEEKKKQTRQTARERRLNTPPTWKSALTRAGMAAAIMFPLTILLFAKSHRISSAIVFTAFAFAFYVPAGYYIDMTIYRRRQRKKQELAAPQGDRLEAVADRVGAQPRQPDRAMGQAQDQAEPAAHRAALVGTGVGLRLALLEHRRQGVHECASQGHEHCEHSSRLSNLLVLVREWQTPSLGRVVEWQTQRA